MSGKIEIELVKSTIGHTRDIRATVRALGLRRIRQKSVKPDTAVIRGMVNKIEFLVRVKKI